MMNTRSPLTLLDLLADQAQAKVKLPAWLTAEVQNRIYLLVNHVLMQEPQAMQRLQRQANRRIDLRWRGLTARITITPAGLLAAPDPQSSSDQTPAMPDLVILLPQSAPSELLQSLAQGQRPDVRIEGDVQLAAEVNWIVEHVRWDIEEDLARLLGDAPAHVISEAARRVAAALRGFASRAPGA